MNSFIFPIASYMFILEKMEATNHYLDRRNQRILNLELLGLQPIGKSAPAELLDSEQLEAIKKKVLLVYSIISEESIEKMTVDKTNPPSYYAIKMASIVIKNKHDKYYPIIKADTVIGNEYYALSVQDNLLTIVLLPTNKSQASIISKMHDHNRRENKIPASMGFQEFAKNAKVLQIPNTNVIIDTEESFDEFKVRITNELIPKDPEKAPDFAGGFEKRDVKLPFEDKEFVLSPGAEIELRIKDQIVNKKIKNDWNTKVAEYNKDDKSVILTFDDFIEVETASGEKKKLPSRKTLKIGDAVIIKPARVSDKDLTKIRLATGNNDLTIDDVQGAKFVGRITNSGEYAATRFTNAKYPVPYIKINGDTIKF